MAKSTPKKAVKSPQKATKSAEKGRETVELTDSFIRDLSVECFMPPSLQPSQKRELELSISAGVRPVGDNHTCVGIAIRGRVVTLQKQLVMVVEMIQECIYKDTSENSKKSTDINVQVANQGYDLAKETLKSVLAKCGAIPPLPEKVDFTKMLQK